ncbi:MAG: GAF domain-containing sensor histidine kinase [Acidobacteriota bacterium]
MEDRSRRTERIIGFARLILAVAGINSAVLTSGEAESLIVSGFAVATAYILYSVAVLWTIDRYPASISRIGFYSQALDSLWFPFLLVYSTTSSSPFFLYYVFSLVSASFRWGFRETLLVNAANIAFFTVVEVAVAGSSFDLGQYLPRPTYLTVLACLIGYLGEHQRRSRRQLVALNQLSSSIRVKEQMSGVLRELMKKVQELFRAEECILVYHAKEIERHFMLRSGPRTESSPQNRPLELPAGQAELFLQPGHNLGYYWNPTHRLRTLLGLKSALSFDFDARRPSGSEFSPADRLVALLEATSILSVPVILNEEFRGRIYLVNHRDQAFSLTDLLYFQLVVSQIGPLLENYRLLKRMRTLSVLEEKGRIARDLHDGLVQSLASLDLRLQACGKTAQNSPADVWQEIQEIQKIVRTESSQLREYMKRLKTPPLVAEELMEALEASTKAFQEDTGIDVRLTFRPKHIDLPRRAAGEIYQIVHESLTNVKKHARAGKVSILIEQNARETHVTIDDDGRGFPPERCSDGEVLQLPWSIQERARGLSGSLKIQSKPGKGSRLQISLPANRSQ